jgi:hypothetical protein
MVHVPAPAGSDDDSHRHDSQEITRAALLQQLDKRHFVSVIGSSVLVGGLRTSTVAALSR